MSENEAAGSPRSLKTVTRAFEVVRLLEALDGAGVTEIADELDMSKSAVYNYLTTLRENRFVVKDGDTYSLSLQFLLLGEYVRNRNVLYRFGKKELEELAAETGEYAHLATEQHGLSVNLYKVKGSKAVGTDYQTSKLQKPDYLHVSATGKSILAFMPPERVRDIVARYGLVRKTANTITDPDELFEELEQIRERGYAYNDEEEVEGLRAIGAPIRDRNGRVLGSLSVSGPTSRMNEESYHDDVVETVINTANVIEVNINMANSRDDLPSFL